MVLTARSADSPRPASPLDIRGLARHRTVAWQSSAGLPRVTGSLCYPKSRSQARRRVCGVAAPDSVTPGGRGRATQEVGAGSV